MSKNQSINLFTISSPSLSFFKSKKISQMLSPEQVPIFFFKRSISSPRNGDASLQRQLDGYDECDKLAPNVSPFSLLRWNIKYKTRIRKNQLPVSATMGQHWPRA